jgi:hypothetical protein
MSLTANGICHCLKFPQRQYLGTIASNVLHYVLWSMESLNIATVNDILLIPLLLVDLEA